MGLEGAMRRLRGAGPDQGDRKWTRAVSVEVELWDRLKG